MNEKCGVKMKFLLYLSQNYSFEIMRPLLHVMLEEQHDVRWFVEGNKVNHALFQKDDRVLNCVDDVIRFNPDATFLPGNIVPSFIPGIKVQLFHGFEWKKKGHFRIRGCFDLYCTQGPFFTRRFNQLRERNPHFTVKETGWTKLDNLFQSDYRPPSVSSKPTILYAPTFSPRLTSADALFEQILALSTQQSWNWKVKFHPKMATKTVERFEQAQHGQLDVVQSSCINPLLTECDVMLSDTSSVITEFLLLGKPVITYQNAQPEPVLLNINSPTELPAAINASLAMDPSLAQTIDSYAKDKHPYRDGLSARRVLDATLEEIQHYPRPGTLAKPKNWLRNLKLRKRLGYWR